MYLVRAPLFTTPTITCRNNLDSEINPSGRVHLCRALGLSIVNGRFIGDSLGRFTSALGSSVVDYAITGMYPSTISAVAVRQQSPLSDHNQINMFFKHSDQISDTEREPSKLFNLNPMDISIYDQNQYVSTRNGVNKATDDFNMIFHKAAIKADLIKQKQKPVKRQNTKKWFDQECKTIRKELRVITNEIDHQITQPDASDTMKF